MVYWIPWTQTHRNRHQDHRNRMSFSRFTVKNVFWWRPSLISNFRREPLECRRVSRDFWNLHTQNPLGQSFMLLSGSAHQIHISTPLISSLTDSALVASRPGVLRRYPVLLFGLGLLYGKYWKYLTEMSSLKTVAPLCEWINAREKRLN